jgi:hypothetical protein
MPTLLIHSRKLRKLQTGWSWPLRANDLAGALAPLIELDAFLEIHFWDHQHHDRRERDARLVESRFQGLALWTEIEPTGLLRPREMPTDRRLLIQGRVFPVPVAALPAGVNIRAKTAEVLRQAIRAHRVGLERLEVDLWLHGRPPLGRCDLRGWHGLRPLPAERIELPLSA